MSERNKKAITILGGFLLGFGGLVALGSSDLASEPKATTPVAPPPLPTEQELAQAEATRFEKNLQKLDELIALGKRRQAALAKLDVNQNRRDHADLTVEVWTKQRQTYQETYWIHQDGLTAEGEWEQANKIVKDTIRKTRDTRRVVEQLEASLEIALEREAVIKREREKQQE